MTPTTRTLEEKAAWAARMQAAKLAKAAATPPAATPEPPIAAPAPAPTITRLTRHRPSAPSPSSALAAGVPATQSSVPALLSALESLPLDSVSYADCGLLLNALSSFTTAVGQRRRLAQEQLQAGTHRAPCNTCGRIIDISKPGGYQCLTERDEHFAPVNRFYCSQNCVLAKNMPSHVKVAAKEKRA